MSSVNDILAKTTALIEALRGLVETDTVQSLPEVASDLGIEGVLNDGVDALVELLTALDVELGKLDEVIDQLDAFGGMLALLEPLVGALGRMIGDSGDELASYGLDQAVVVTGPISDGLGAAERALAVAANVVVDATRFDELRTSLLCLAREFYRLKTTVEADAALPGYAALVCEGDAA